MKFMSLCCFMVFFNLVGWSQEPLSIEVFGQYGERAATFFGEPLAPEFYEQSQMTAIADGRNFVANLSLKTPVEERKMAGLLLTLTNPTENTIQVVVSAERPGAIKTFVIPVPAEEVMEVDGSTLMHFNHLYLISTEEMTYAVSKTFADAEFTSHELEVHSPREEMSQALSAKSGYCATIQSVAITMWGYDSIAAQWVTVPAYASRRTGAPSKYYINIHYPVFGAIFHRGIDASNQIGTCHFQTHETFSPVTGKRLVWSGMDDLLFGYSNLATAVHYGTTVENWFINRR